MTARLSVDKSSPSKLVPSAHCLGGVAGRAPRARNWSDGQNLSSVVASCGATGWVCDLLAAQHGTRAAYIIGLKGSALYKLGPLGCRRV